MLDMRLSMDLELKDVPGQLLLALKPVSDANGNIISVMHHRDRKTPRGTIPVNFIVEIENVKLDNVRNQLLKSGITVVRMGEERFIKKITVVLVGHILDSDLADTVSCIDNTGFAEVVSLSLIMPAIGQPSAAYLVIRAVGEIELQKAMTILREIGEWKKLLVIEPVEEEEL
jgi:ACT domain-containing protein